MTKFTKVLFFGLVLFAQSIHALAWSDHALGTLLAIKNVQNLEAEKVPAESLEKFLMATQDALAAMLETEEQFIKGAVQNYPPRPDELKFKSGQTSASIKNAFLRAIRVNPNMKLPLFLQQIPNRPFAQKNTLSIEEVSIIKSGVNLALSPFLMVHDEEKVSATDVLTTASDEPDYGLDIGLWSDNGTEWGAQYRWGAQPFGNPTVDFSSQAPFHMGFYHESKIIYSAASFLKRTFPEARIHLYQSLSKFAFRNGHPYWGYRFAGWALHYIQDLTQPYHSTVLPGVSDAKMLAINIVDMIGIHAPKTNALQLVTNRHFALENYQFGALKKIHEKVDFANPLAQSLIGTDAHDVKELFSFETIRKTLTEEANEQSKKLDRVLKKSLPKELVRDPKYYFGTTDPNVDVVTVLESRSVDDRKKMSEALAERLGAFGKYTRTFLKSVQMP